MFGKIVSSVVWSDATAPDGQQLVPVDPLALAADINTNGFAFLKGHDPGVPLGKVLRAAVFTSPGGTKFVAAILGYYAGGNRLSFRDLGFDPATVVSSPSLLPALTDACWINFASDPREVESAWLEDVLSTAPLRVERIELSHNAAEPLQELIRVGLLFMALVWNPFITTIATEAGKDAYAGIHRWLRTLFEKLAERHNPVVEIQSYHDECQFSFIFRGTDVKRHYAAHDALPVAVAQAEQLAANMKSIGNTPKLILYEFHPQDDKWFPSYAELYDGRFVTDNNILIAVEQLPSGLSLGLSRGKDKPRVPSVKRLS
ncbi:MAG: hypothetical protein CR217_06540 [Beijerinckiaceae bacterium]|nr:MAG: hypothetical protein CR217_06540 [Beijerinckiaceae bacterium]